MKVIFSDLDGTLLNSRKSAVLTTQDTFKHFDFPIPTREQIVDKMGIPIEKTFPEFACGALHKEDLPDVLAYFRKQYVYNSMLHSVLFDGVQEFLDACTSLKFPVVVVTSKKTESAERDLARLGILDSIFHVIGSDKVSNYKPEPDSIYRGREALKEYTIDAEVMIGDAEVDILMGKAAGIKTCAVTWGSHSEERLMSIAPDFLARKVDDLLLMLENL